MLIMSRKGESENCVFCVKEISHHTNEIDNSQNIECLKKVTKTFRVDVDDASTSRASICNECQWVIDVSSHWYEKYQSQIEQIQKKPERYLEASMQTDIDDYIIIITDLPLEMTPEQLEKKLSNYGTIIKIDIQKNGFCEQLARISFSNNDDITRLLNGAQNGELLHESKPLLISRLPADRSLINTLPNDCLLEIFKKLDDPEDRLQLEGVCKRWKKIALKSWSNVTSLPSLFSDGYDAAKMKLILKRCGSFLRNFDVDHEEDPKMPYKHLAQNCINLETLKIWAGSCELVDRDEFHFYIKEIIQKSPKLRRLSSIYARKHLEYDYLDLLPKEMLEIRFLADEPTAVSVDLSKFVDLLALELIRYEFDECSLKGIENLTKLQHLSLLKCRTHPSNIRKIVHFRNLQFLEIPDCQLDDDILIRILRNNPMLRHLDISGNPAVTDHSFEHMAGLKSLLINQLHQVTGLYFRKLNVLETLNCDECYAINDLELLMLIDSSTKLTYIHALGTATWRLIIGAIETVKLQRTDRKLEFIVDDELYHRLKETDYKGSEVRVNRCLGEAGDANNMNREWLSEGL